MDYAVYPFKRENKYRLYLKCTTASGKRKALSTGVTYPLNATKKERDKAYKEAERKAIDILMEHFKDRGFMKGTARRAARRSGYAALRLS